MRGDRDYLGETWGVLSGPAGYRGIQACALAWCLMACWLDCSYLAHGSGAVEIGRGGWGGFLYRRITGRIGILLCMAGRNLGFCLARHEISNRLIFLLQHFYFVSECCVFSSPVRPSLHVTWYFVLSRCVGVLSVRRTAIRMCFCVLWCVVCKSPVVHPPRESTIVSFL